MKKDPPGKIKIKNSLRYLLEEKDFDSITTAEIASNAGVTEGLIYKYFKDKQGLLYELVAEMFSEVLTFIKGRIEDDSDPDKKLEAFIFSSIDTYAKKRVFAKIILIEVRSMPSFFQSKPYGHVKEYSRYLLNIIEDGMNKNFFRNDMNPKTLRDMILGSIEHTCLWGLIFSRKIDCIRVSSEILSILTKGIR